MSKTTQYRYEVGSEGYGVIEHTRDFAGAVTIAQNWLEREKTIPYIYDRMSHKGRPKLFEVKPCTGEAHKNPFIDNCPVCMPYWGVVVRPKKETEEDKQ